MDKLTFRTSKGVEIEYFFRNNENRFIIIFHGWAHSKDRWINFSEKYFDQIGLIIMDLPGFGASKYNHPIFGFDFYVDAVKELIDSKHVSISDAILIGHSFGGCVALSLSRNVSPEKLILIDVPLIPIWAGKLMRAIRNLKYPLISIGIKSKLVVYLLSRLTVSKFKFIDNMMVADAQRMSSVVAASTLTLLGMRDSIPNLLNLPFPILTIHGKKDLIVSSSQYNYISINPKIKTVFINDSGHSPFIESEHVTGDLINEFINSSE